MTLTFDLHIWPWLFICIYPPYSQYYICLSFIWTIIEESIVNTVSGELWFWTLGPFLVWWIFQHTPIWRSAFSKFCFKSMQNWWMMSCQPVVATFITDTQQFGCKIHGKRPFFIILGQNLVVFVLFLAKNQVFVPFSHKNHHKHAREDLKVRLSTEWNNTTLGWTDLGQNFFL